MPGFRSPLRSMVPPVREDPDGGGGYGRVGTGPSARPPPSAFPLRAMRSPYPVVVRSAGGSAAGRWSQTFDGDSASVGRVRRFVIDMVVSHHVAARESTVVGDLVLLVSELAANAVLHAGGVFEVTVTVADETVRIEVSDQSDSLPRRRDLAMDQPGGRGYQIVDSLADRWGCTKLAVGKSVWAELRVA